MPLEQVSACPVCERSVFKPLIVCKDYTTSGELFHVEQCTHCQIVITNPRPTQEAAGKYYNSSSYISHTSEAAGIIDYIYLIIRRFTIRWKCNLVRGYLKNNLLLDVGCGTGNFINYCSNSGIKTYGVEPSSDARAANRNENIVESLDKLPTIRFDVITLWHVLEHIYDLPQTIVSLKNLLEENGTIFIAVPNLESYDAMKYKEQWAGYDVPRHVWHFSKLTMTTLVEKAGLKVTQIIPMKLDSYYVSLLSEKNSANGKLRFINSVRAISVGFLSNIKGRKSMNYSSLIYRIQK